MMYLCYWGSENISYQPIAYRLLANISEHLKLISLKRFIGSILIRFCVLVVFSVNTVVQMLFNAVTLTEVLLALMPD